MSNCALSASNYGSKGVTVISVSHGMQVDATVGFSRHAKALYSKAHSAGSFSITMVFRDYGEFDAFNKWMQGYGSRLSNPGTNVGPMRVTVPVRNFDRVGVPQSSIPFGDSVGDLLHSTTVSFLTTRDLTTIASNFENSSIDNQSRYFYPAGEQLSGSQSGAGDALYDYQRDTNASAATIFRQLYGDGDVSAGIGR